MLFCVLYLVRASICCSSVGMSVDTADKKLSKSFINSDFVVSEKKWVEVMGVVVGAIAAETIVRSVEDGYVRDVEGWGFCIS